MVLRSDTRDMSAPARPAQISAEDWSATPAAVQDLIEQLLARLHEVERQPSVPRPPRATRRNRRRAITKVTPRSRNAGGGVGRRSVIPKPNVRGWNSLIKCWTSG